ncbi:MAG: DegV family protein [Gudongella sp.]|nr:DegV family protein [Gudongella sp.]
MGVRVMTDSTSYIDKDLRESLDIEILSLLISFEDESIKETEIDNKVFYQMMERKGIPVSSQPVLGEMYQRMLDIVSKGDDLVCVFISAEMSGTFNSACKVSEEVMKDCKDSKIVVLDSRSNSMQLGFAAITAARAAKEGKSIDEVVELVERNIKRSRFLFIPDNLEYLKKGGRIGGAAALFGKMLQIIPVLTVKSGKTAILEKVRTKTKAIKVIFNRLLKDNLEFKIKEIVVHHINCYEQAKELADKLKDKFDMEISIVDIGPIIGMHVGPGAIGIAYYTEEEISN